MRVDVLLEGAADAAKHDEVVRAAVVHDLREDVIVVRARTVPALAPYPAPLGQEQSCSQQ